MADTIVWLGAMEDAMGRAKSEGKPILLDFYNPG